MKRNLVLSSVIALMLSSSIVGCGSKNEVIEIGVLQYAQVDALDSAYKGFTDKLASSLEEGSYTINFKNASADSTNNTAGASQLVSSCDLVLGIATPSATALQNEAYLQDKDIPILFTAVTDAALSGLVDSNEVPGGNITGTSDMNPVAKQIDLIREIKPEATKVGLIYCSNESNSKIQADIAEEECETLGLDLTIKTIDNASGIESAITSLKAANIDALYIPTDNVCASSMSTIVSNLSDTNVLIVAGESGQVSAGAHVSLGVDYYELGKITGEMAVEILVNGADPATMAVRQMENYELVINQESLDDFGITLTQEFLDKVGK